MGSRRSNREEGSDSSLDRVISALAATEDGDAAGEADLARATEAARLEYFLHDTSGDSFAGLLRTYRSFTYPDPSGRFRARPERALPGTAEIVPEILADRDEEARISRSGTRPFQARPPTSRRVRRHLARDSVAEARRRHGLDKVAETVLDRLAEMASFERGLAFLCRHIQTLEGREGPTRARPGPTGSAGRRKIARTGDLAVMKRFVASRYPDITADEVSLCALLEPTGEPLLFDSPRFDFHPPAIVGMTTECLLFLDPSASEILADGIDAVVPHEIAGLTGIDFGIVHAPFLQDVSRAIQALVVLRLSDRDLFAKLFDEEDVTPLLRGDAMLLRHFLQRENDAAFDGAETTLDELLSRRAGARGVESLKTELRRQVNSYLCECDVCNHKGVPYGPTDLVRLVGMLSRLPRFVERGEAFRGYTGWYGQCVEFISDAGEVVDSVPLVTYLALRLRQSLHDGTCSSSKKNRLVHRVFTELWDRVQERNILEGHTMSLDDLQLEILGRYDVFVPIECRSRLRRCRDVSTFFLRKSADNRVVQRTLKLGFRELRLIHEILDSLPREFSRGFTEIAKTVCDPAEGGAFPFDTMLGGAFNARTRTILVTTPVEGSPPIYTIADAVADVCRESTPRMAPGALPVDPAARALQEHRFLHILLHEIAESILEERGEGLLAPWRPLSPNAAFIPLRRRWRFFVSRYATCSATEDFCETFAFYALCGSRLRRVARRSPCLAAKYAFMKALFGCDGRNREFDDRFDHSPYAVLDDPRLTPAELATRNYLELLREERSILDLPQRNVLAETALSYNEVEEVIEESEEEGIPIRIADAVLRLRERKAEEGSDLWSSSRAAFLGELKAVAILATAGATIDDIAVRLPNIFDAVVDGSQRETLDLLEKIGVKRHRRAVAAELERFFAVFEDVLRPHLRERRLREDDIERAGRVLSEVFRTLDTESPPSPFE